MVNTNQPNFRGFAAGVVTVLLLLTTAYTAYAEDAEDAEEEFIEEVVVTGDLRSLPGENVESVFGFQKSLLELPRSASTVSWEQIERFNIKDIDELIALAPGTFTQSFKTGTLRPLSGPT